MSDQTFDFNFSGTNGERLDKFLVECMPEFSRSSLQGLIDDGFVSVDEKAITKAGTKLVSGQKVVIHIPPSEPTNLIAENIPLDILFENDEVLVINKPAGMVVHPAAGHDTGTLVHAVLGHVPDLEGIGGEQRPGVVHRLDRDTSGLIVMAKDERTHRWLQDQFRDRDVDKHYLALVDGMPPTPTGRVEAAVGRDPAHRKQMAIVPVEKGREAVSEYRTVEQFSKHTLLEVHPLTGRTHQIRLHMKFLHCPIVGDVVYGHKTPTIPISRQFLHAFRLTILLPGEKEARTFEAPLPDELEKVLIKLRSK